MYNHCQSQLVALDCDSETLSMFQQLTKDDLNASTAILKPNAPGSTNLCLSWIWHNAHNQTGVIANHEGNAMAGANANANASQFWECEMYFLATHSNYTNTFIVRRVHWLQSQAQRNRWREEFLLVTYEMEWAVWYFIYHSQQW